jgi:hypothetical protein
VDIVVGEDLRVHVRTQRAMTTGDRVHILVPAQRALVYPAG